MISVWGANSHGQLGTRCDKDLFLPKSFKIDINPKLLSAGSGHTLISDGITVLQTGNYRGDFNIDESNFHVISLPCNSKIVDICAGWNFSLFLTSDNKIFGLGSNSHGQLGTRTIDTDPYQEDKILKLGAGLRFSCFLTASGDVYVWGENYKNRIIQSASKIISVPTNIQILNNIIDISCGRLSITAIKKDGSVLSLSFDGLNFGTKHYAIEIFGGRVISTSSGWGHVLALTENGEVFSWGRNNLGQLGHLKTDLPSKVPFPSNVKIRNVSAGADHSIATDGKNVYAWGWNEHGMCGCPKSTEQVDDIVRIPIIIQNLPDRVDYIGSGYGHSFSLTLS